MDTLDGDIFLHVLTHTSVKDIMHMRCVSKFHTRIQCLARVMIVYQEACGGGGFPASLHNGVLEFANNRPLSMHSESKTIHTFNDSHVIHFQSERDSVLTGTVPAGLLRYVLVGYAFKTKCGRSFEECINNN